MKNEATQKGVSAADAENNDEALDTGANGAQNSPVDRMHPAAQREAMLANFAKHREQNPDAESPNGGLGVVEGDEEENTDDEDEEGEVTETPPKGQPPAAAADEEKVDDYIVKDANGKLAFKTIVDGKEVLVPVSRARAQLQKHEAADVRLQTASERLREADRIKAAAAQSAQPRSPSATDVSVDDDEALNAEAKELVTSLLEEEDQDAIAKKLAKTLKGRTTKVDPKAVAEEAVNLIRQQSTDAALVDGYNAYMKEFGETVDADPSLRAWHAAKVDELVAANPNWTPKQAMLEAGEMACKFAGIKRGSQVSDAGGDPPPANDRQQRKQALQPVPQNRSAVRGTGAPEKTQPDTPRDVVNQMRKVRGQPVVGAR